MAQNPDKPSLRDTIRSLPPLALAGIAGFGLSTVYALLFGLSFSKFIVALIICIAFAFGMLKLTSKA